MAEANRVVDTAILALAADLGAKMATTRIQRQFENGVQVPFISFPGAADLLQRRYGFPVIFQDKKPLTSDHPLMAVDRAVIRDITEGIYSLGTSSIPTLYVGCGAYEPSRFIRNPRAEFSFHYLCEAKDIGRTILPLLEETLSNFQRHVASSSGTAKVEGRNAASLRATITKIDDLFEAYETLSPESFQGTRLHLGYPEKTFPRLVAFDSCYEMDEENYFDLFDRHGATEMVATMFMPAEFICEDVVEDSEYIFEKTFTNWDGVVDMSLRATKSLMHSFLKWQLGPMHTAVRLAYHMWGSRNELRELGLKMATSQVLGYCSKMAEANYPFTMTLLRAASLATICLFRMYDSRANITFKRGTSNGYDHCVDTWSLLFRKCALTSPTRSYTIVVEVIQRAGDHYLFSLHRSESSQRLVKSIGLPVIKETVLVLDLVKTFRGGLENFKPEYFPVAASEYHMTMNFLCGQMDQTLTVESVQTLINRASMGVKIATTEHAPRWTMEPARMWPFAVAICMEAQRTHGDVKSIVEQHRDKWLNGKRNARWLFETLLKGLVGLASFGTAVPLALAYNWLATTHPTLLLVKFPPNRVKLVWQPSEGTTLCDDGIRESVPIYDRTITLPRPGAAPELACPTLRLMQPFGKQQPMCLHPHGEKARKVRISMSDEEVATLRAHIKQTMDASPAGLRDTLRKFADLMPRLGFSFELEVFLIIGGPGTGKSFTCRNMITNWEKEISEKIVVFAPFGKLAPDYPQTPKDGQPAFDFCTTHRLVERNAVGVAVLDEYTCMDERILLASLYKTSTTRLVLVGDEKQTGVLPHEGDRIFSAASKLSMRDVHAHILTKQFRSDMFPVAWCNKFRDSGIYAVNDRVNIPTIHPMCDFSKLPSNYVVMPFSHDTAYECGLSVGTENSVRSNQGGTLENVAIPVATRDLMLLQNEALFMVAITRHKVTGNLRFYADDGPERTAVEQMLGFHDEEFMKNIASYARPDLQKLYGTAKFEDEGKFKEVITRLYKSGIVSNEIFEGVSDYMESSARTVETLWQEVRDKYDSKPVSPVSCSSCSSQTVYTFGDVTICADCKEEGEFVDAVDLEREKNAEMEKIRFDYDFSGEGWCLPQSSLTAVRETKGARRIRIEQTKDKDPSYKESVPLNLDAFAGYKDWLRREGILCGRDGVTVDVFVRYLEEIKVQYIIQVLAEHDNSVEEFYKSKTLDFSLPTAMLSVRLGHASPMPWADVLLFSGIEKYHFNEPGAVDFSLLLEGHVTFGEVEARYPSWKLVYRGDLTLPLCKAYRQRQVYGFREKRKIGRKPVWGETYVKPFNTFKSVPAGPRTFSLGAERLVSAGDFMAVETEDVEVTPSIVRDNLHGTDVYSLVGAFDAGVHSLERENRLRPSFATDKPLSNVSINMSQLICPTKKKTGQFDFDGANIPEFSFSSGFGVHQANNDPEKLAAAWRYVGKKPTFRYSVSGAKLMRKMAIKAHMLHYQHQEMPYDPYLEMAVISGFEYDSNNRGYPHRVERDFESGNAEAEVTFSCKAQDKPQKKVQVVDGQKDGQGISAVSPTTNYLYGAMFRVLNMRKYHAAKPTKIYDCGMSERSLKSAVREQLNQNEFLTTVTHDVVKCDMNQNWATAYAQMIRCLLLGNVAWHPMIERYFRDIREMYTMKAHGLFSAVVQGPKPSGAPDTLMGNGDVVEMYCDYVTEIYGPRVDLEKGDDKVTWCTRAVKSEERVKEVALYTSFVADTVYGSAQFTGKVVTPDGMYDDVVRKARKALMHRARNYQEFAKYQESLRDTLDQIKEVGIIETVGNTAHEYEISISEAYWYYQILYSLAHISFEQWGANVKDRQFARPIHMQVKHQFIETAIRVRWSSYTTYVAALPKRVASKTLTRREQRKRQRLTKTAI